MLVVGVMDETRKRPLSFSASFREGEGSEETSCVDGTFRWVIFDGAAYWFVCVTRIQYRDMHGACSVTEKTVWSREREMGGRGAEGG